MIVSFLFSFKLKIIPSYRSRCVSVSFLERIDSYPYASHHFQSWSVPNRKKYFPMGTEGLSDMKIGTEQQRCGMMETQYKNTFSYRIPPLAASVTATCFCSTTRLCTAAFLQYNLPDYIKLTPNDICISFISKYCTKNEVFH